MSHVGSQYQASRALSNKNKQDPRSKIRSKFYGSDSNAARDTGQSAYGHYQDGTLHQGHYVTGYGFQAPQLPQHSPRAWVQIKDRDGKRSSGEDSDGDSDEPVDDYSDTYSNHSNDEYSRV